jgi:4-hydroxybenzoate polyprenyltransferase
VTPAEEFSKKARTFFELIKFEHTAFALPFAYMGMVMAARGWPGWRVFLLVTLAMASARTAGMTLNRLIDRKIDAQNPRTRSRPLVSGTFKTSWAWTGVAASVFLLLVSAGSLNPLCLKLSPVALALLTGYHYAKRFTPFCHWVLGAVLGAAPIGGWLAVTGAFSWEPLLLAMAVMCWVAGFDILYSLQDVDFDRSAKLHSIPVRYGVSRALTISAANHVAALVFFALFGWAAGLGAVFAAGLAIVAVLLRIEHGLVGDGDLSRINTAFFTINGWVGILLFVFTSMDIYR